MNAQEGYDRGDDPRSLGNLAAREDDGKRDQWCHRICSQADLGIHGGELGPGFEVCFFNCTGV